MPRVDKQECLGVSDAESSDVTKLDKLKKKLSLISIASKILSFSFDYKLKLYNTSLESLFRVCLIHIKSQLITLDCLLSRRIVV